MLKNEQKQKKKEKVTRKLNEILIERIKKYNIQDSNQLINSPNDGDTNYSYLGGLINFDGEESNYSDYEINSDLEKITYNDIYIKPYKFKEYEDTEEIENDDFDFDKKENSTENITKLLSENYNEYLNIIQKNYKKYASNHSPKIISISNIKQNKKNNIISKKLYETKKGEKIIVNDEIYETSLTYLQNKDLFLEIPPRYQNPNEEFTIDYNILEENMENIQKKSFEFIELNSHVSTSMSKVLLYCNKLENYIKQMLTPFNETINSSCQKISRDKELISQIKYKTMKNSGNIILTRLKRNNTKKLIAAMKKYKNVKNTMNSLELYFTENKKTQEIYDLINVCKGEIEKIKNINIQEKNSEKLIEIFEQKLMELKERNDSQMSGELSEELNSYFKKFLIFSEKNDDKEQILKNFGISKFISEKLLIKSNKYDNILLSLNFTPPNEEMEKISKICEYYIDGNLISSIYLQLKEIFSNICEQTMNYILNIFREKLSDNKNLTQNKNKDLKLDNEKSSTEVSNENENDKNEQLTELKSSNSEQNIKKEIVNDENILKDELNENDELFILLCILLSKNKLNDIITSFIDIVINKVEKSEKIEKKLKENILNECNEIKTNINENIKNITKDQIKKCLDKISLNDDLDKFINNYHLALELIKEEIPKYNPSNSDNKSSNKLNKILIKEQKNFIENWAKKYLNKFDSEEYKSWDELKEIPREYQSIINLFFSFDLENHCMKDETIINQNPIEKINEIKESLEEENNNNNEGEEKNDEPEELLTIKDGEKPEITIKINKLALDIINISLDLLKIFTLFHKECYESILTHTSSIFIAHLNFQTEQIYEEQSEFEVSESEISMSYSIFILIQALFEHIKESEFFVIIAKNSSQKSIDRYLEINKNINKCLTTSKKKIEDILNNQCIKESLNKLKEIKLPNYNVVTGNSIVNQYSMMFVGNLKEIYKNMMYSYEESFIKDLMNKALEEFFGNFEDFILHGQKIEDEDSLKQFKKDMIFLKKNLVFIKILDLTHIIERIDNINKSVLPESMLKVKKK